MKSDITFVVAVAVIGDVDSGKSTLIAVLSKGNLDDGRGTLRFEVLRHAHEMTEGRTSSITQQVIGFDATGCITNYMSAGVKSMTVQEIVAASSKLVTLVDLAGHEKYLRTTGERISCDCDSPMNTVRCCYANCCLYSIVLVINLCHTVHAVMRFSLCLCLMLSPLFEPWGGAGSLCIIFHHSRSVWIDIASAGLRGSDRVRDFWCGEDDPRTLCAVHGPESPHLRCGDQSGPCYTQTAQLHHFHAKGHYSCERSQAVVRAVLFVSQ